MSVVMMGKWATNINPDYQDEQYSKYCDECGCLWTEHDVERDWESGIEEAVCPDCPTCGESMYDHVRDGDKIICPRNDK